MTKNTQGSEWEEKFTKKFVIDKDWKRVRPSEMMYFIEDLLASSNQALLQKVRELVDKYDESPDDAAGYEIRIKKAVEFRTKLAKLEVEI